MDTAQVKQLKDELNEKQLKAFEELKKQVLEQSLSTLKDVSDEQRKKYTEDNQMVRLLIAREFKVEKSLEMWKLWVQWRLDFKADSIQESDIVEELKSGKAFWHGHDKLGNPCLIVKVKYHKPGVSSQDTVLRFFLFMLEEGIKRCEASGTGKISIIWDREGFDRKNFDYGLLDTFKKLNKIIQDNYAERLKTVYILHPNWFLKTIFAITKAFLSARTKEKIIIIDKQEELFKVFDREQLLFEHGGTSRFVYQYPFPIKKEIDPNSYEASEEDRNRQSEPINPIQETPTPSEFDNKREDDGTDSDIQEIQAKLLQYNNISTDL